MNKIFNFLLISGILITPFLNIGEIYALFTGALENQTTVYTNPLIKGLKDVIFILLISISLLNVLTNKFKLSNITIVYFFLLFFLIIPMLLTLPNANELELFAGIRWGIPFLLLLLMYLNKGDILQRLDINNIRKILILLFFLHFIIQIIQFFSGISWFGLLFDRFSLRSPGMFLMPNTGAFFSTLVFLFIAFSKEKLNRIDYLLIFMISVSIIIASSGTGIVSLFVLLLLRFLPKKFLLFTPALFIVAFYFGINIVSYFRGDEYLKISGGERIDIFLVQLSDSKILSTEMGKYTNTFMLISPDKGKIMDSTYASILGNLGLFPFLTLQFLTIIILIKSFLLLNRTKMSLISLIILFGATTIINETYPMNLLLVILIAKEFFFKNFKENKL